MQPSLSFHRKYLVPIIVCFSTCVCSAQWSPPGPRQLARLETALAHWDRQFDPKENMVREPFSTPGYHTTLKGGLVHSTRTALYYALGLLDTGRAENLPRAIAILRRVVALQDTDPTSPTFGVWSWYLEEPLSQMRPPDWNWADFNGVTLLQISRDHRSSLPPDLARSVDAAILNACRAIKKRDVGPGYTNISIMGTYVTLVAGEQLNIPEFSSYGLQRLANILAFTKANGSFEEYNSPTYTVVALHDLSRLKAHVQNPAAQAMIAPLLRRAWEELANHFHVPTRQWAGPHSRDYASFISETTLALIQRATSGRVDFGVDRPDREELRLPVECPADLEPLFQSLPAPRTITETFIRRSNTVGTTYLHPDFSLGSINHGDLWNQRRALLLQFGSPRRPGYLRLRFLKNGYDFASAWLTASQRAGLVVGVVNLVTDGGDTHIALDKVVGGKIRARDLRLRFELGGAAGASAGITTEAESNTFRVRLDNLMLNGQILYAKLDGQKGRLIVGGDDAHRWVDVVLYEGKEREIDLGALAEAAVGLVLAVGPHGVAESELEQGNLKIACEGLSVIAPIKPAPRPFGDFHNPKPDELKK